MKKTLLSLSGALALAALSPTESAAQFTVWKDGVSVYALEEGRADYVTFDYSPVGSLADAEPDPSVGGAVPDESAAVDLGLTSGTLWAPWNVGATKPGEAGAYFAWGETAAKESYDWSTYKWMKEGESDWTHINKYTTEDNQAGDWYTRTFTGDGKTTLDESDDAAAVNWGGDWRTPTQAQLRELYDYCTLEWKEADWDANGSLAGYLLTSNANGKKLFLPAAGGRWDSDLNDVGSYGGYWSAELNSGDSYYARNLYFRSGLWYADNDSSRASGFSVRPVCPSAETTKAYNTPDASVGGQVPTAAEAVDLGLPSGTLWAPWNVGATKPGEAGAYFSWGETAAKESYYWDTYKWMKEGESDWTHINKYTTEDNQGGDWYTRTFVGDGKTTLDTADDAAAQNWGGKWRMPTRNQLNELFTECTSEWKDADWDANGSLAGYLLTGPNGKRLFLPAAGRRWGSDLRGVGSNGYYWSAELRSGYSYYARDLYFYSGYWGAGYNSNRGDGFSVRPVCPSAE